MATHKILIVTCDGHWQGEKCQEFVNTHQKSHRRARETARLVYGWREWSIRRKIINLCANRGHDEEGEIKDAGAH